MNRDSLSSLISRLTKRRRKAIIIGSILIVCIILVSVLVSFLMSSLKPAKASITVSLGAVIQGNYYDSFYPDAPAGDYVGITITATGFPPNSPIRVRGPSDVPRVWLSSCNCSNGWKNAETNSSGDFVGTSYCGVGSNNRNACLTDTGQGATSAPPGTYKITVIAGGVKASFKITIKAGNSNITGESGLFSFPRKTSGTAGSNVTIFYAECNNIIAPNHSNSTLSPGCSGLFLANGMVSGSMCGVSFPIASSSTTFPWPQPSETKVALNSIIYPIPRGCTAGKDQANLTIASGSGNSAIMFTFTIKVS